MCAAVQIFRALKGDGFLAEGSKAPKGLDGLLKSELISVIDEATLGTENTKIAMMYFLEKMHQADIAAVIGYDRSTVSKRLKTIFQRIEWTAHRLGLL